MSSNSSSYFRTERAANEALASTLSHQAQPWMAPARTRKATKSSFHLGRAYVLLLVLSRDTGQNGHSDAQGRWRQCWRP